MVRRLLVSAALLAGATGVQIASAAPLAAAGSTAVSVSHGRVGPMGGFIYRVRVVVSAQSPSAQAPRRIFTGMNHLMPSPGAQLIRYCHARVGFGWGDSNPIKITYLASNQFGCALVPFGFFATYRDTQPIPITPTPKAAPKTTKP